MTALRGAVGQVRRLFVGDAMTAGLLGAWLAACAGLLRYAPTAIRGPVLFAGVAVVVIASVAEARRRMSR